MEKKKSEKGSGRCRGLSPREPNRDECVEDEEGPRSPGCCVMDVNTACPLWCRLGGLCGMA